MDDRVSQEDRARSQSVAEELDLEWYLYTSGLVRDSRQFCKERQGRFFHKKEVEAWGRGEMTGYPNEFIYPKNGTWPGRNRYTTQRTIFKYLGGEGCMHSIMGTSITIIPRKDIDRAINLGYYTPSRVEAKYLGLPFIEEKKIKREMYSDGIAQSVRIARYMEENIRPSQGFFRKVFESFSRLFR